MGIDLQFRPEVLGARLKCARGLAKLTQETAAQALGLARTTLVAIEAGKRQVTPEELRAFTELYQVSESEFLSSNRPPLDIEVKFRNSGVLSEREADQVGVAALLNRLAASVVELEDLLECQRATLDFPSITLNRGEALEPQAEDAALSLRQRLGIGLGPITNLTAIMESDLGLRVFERTLPPSVSGAVAFDEVHGGFVLLNSRHPLAWRRLSAAHEICHPLLRKEGMEVLFKGDHFDEREEKFCDAFAHALLMPAVSVRRKAAELKGLSNGFTVRHLPMLASYFNVSIDAMARRLSNLGLAPKALLAPFQDAQAGAHHLEQIQQEMDGEPDAPRFTPRLFLLAGAAYDRELLSEQQIAKKLDLDLVTVRRLLEQVSTFGDDAFE